MSEQGIDFQASGLLDGLQGEERDERLALLEHLRSSGVPLEEMRRMSASGTLIFGAANRVLFNEQRYTTEQIAQLSDTDPELLLSARRAMGLAAPEPGAAELTDADLAAARMIAYAHEQGIRDEDMLELLRVLGRSLAQAAESLRALPMKLVMRPGISERDLAAQYGEAVMRLYPMVDPLISSLLTLHLTNATQAEVVSGLERSGGSLAGSREVAVCFADLVGFTRIGEEVPAEELAQLAGRLEVLAGEVARPPVRLVKTIGDAAMLASQEPAALVRAALELVDAADSQGHDFPQLRAGAALGLALPRAGDWFGRPVNIASRITSIARPGSLLVEGELRRAAGEDYRWSFAGERRLRGVRGPLQLFRARRAG